MQQLQEKLMDCRSYKNNHLKIIPGGDGNSIIIVKRNVVKIADNEYAIVSEVIAEYDSYDELAAFMDAVTFMYYEGVHFDD
jgi:hypothetical protein